MIAQSFILLYYYVKDCRIFDQCGKTAESEGWNEQMSRLFTKQKHKHLSAPSFLQGKSPVINSQIFTISFDVCT